MVLTAGLRERCAESAEDAAISSDSEVQFVGNVVIVVTVRPDKAKYAAEAAEAANATPNPQPLPPVVTGEGEQIRLLSSSDFKLHGGGKGLPAAL